MVPSHTLPSSLDGLWFGKPVRVHVRQFGVMFAVICTVIAAWSVYRNADLTQLGVITLGLGVLFFAGSRTPRVLYPVWRAWMAFAERLGVVMTFLILVVGWVLAFVPIALLVRVLGIRVMDLEFRSNVPSYFVKRDPKLDDFKLLERQF